MITLAQLTGAHRHTYRKIFQHPAENAVRHVDVRSLLEQLGEVMEGSGALLKVSRNGHKLLFLSRDKNDPTTKDELIVLQHFLKRSENPLKTTNGREAHILLVIGHHEARLFRSEIYGGHPHALVPDQEHDHFDLSNSAKNPPVSNEDTYDDKAFEPIAEALQCTGEILVFGESSPTEGEMDRFIAWLKRRHPDLAERIVGSEVLERDQADSALLLQKARNFHDHQLRS